MKIAIVDDTPLDRKLVKKLITNYFTEREERYGITPIFEEFEDGESFLENYKPESYDILILDIYMRKYSGLDVAKRVSAIDRNCNIILFTSSTEHQLEGYSIHAIGYVMKPVDQYISALHIALDYVCEKMQMDQTAITVQTDYGPFDIRLSHILYVDCVNRTVLLHLQTKTISTLEKYKDLKLNLNDDKRFLECSRNIIVNMDHIDRPMNDDFILKNGERIPMSRRKKTVALECYMQHFITKNN